jgi:hypothetical protein
METAMPSFTLTRQYLLPVYQHLVIEAQTLEQACEKAIEHSDWEGSREDYDNARETTIECAAVGEWESLWSAKIRFGSSQQVSHAACGELWHDQGMIAFAQIVVRLMADVVGLVMLAMTPRRSLKAQNLFLRESSRSTGSAVSSQGASAPPRALRWHFFPGCSIGAMRWSWSAPRR